MRNLVIRRSIRAGFNCTCLGMAQPKKQGTKNCMGEHFLMYYEEIYSFTAPIHFSIISLVTKTNHIF